MASQLVWAVTDGPDGDASLELPDDRFRALDLKSRHNGMFWCTTKASGCGEPLVLAAGPVVRPYFRHQRGSECTLIGSPAAAPAYEHLQYQRALQQWLAKQGHHAALEKRLGPDGRTDLHVVIDQLGHIIEVQLSPIGTSHVADDVRWVALDACRLTADGFYAPGIDEARELFDDERHRPNTAENHRRRRRSWPRPARRSASWSGRWVARPMSWRSRGNSRGTGREHPGVQGPRRDRHRAQTDGRGQGCRHLPTGALPPDQPPGRCRSRLRPGR